MSNIGDQFDSDEARAWAYLRGVDDQMQPIDLYELARKMLGEAGARKWWKAHGPGGLEAIEGFRLRKLMIDCSCEPGAEHRLHLHWHAYEEDRVVCTDCMPGSTAAA